MNRDYEYEEEDKCANCAWRYDTSFGLTCNCEESMKYSEHVKDYDSCGHFESKQYGY